MFKVAFPLLVAILAVTEAGLVGGPVDGNLEDKDAQNALKFAVDEHNKGSQSKYISQVVEVLNFQQQVVAGMNYFFTVVLANTSCKKNDAVNTCDCTVDPNPDVSQRQECKLTVWSQPWTNTLQLTENTCK